jgi:hypothetical protein
VDVTLGIARKLKVDDVRDVIDVNATRCNIRCYENIDVTLAKAVEGALSGPLALVSVNGGGAKSRAAELLGEPARLVLRAREDNSALHVRSAEQIL